MNANDQHTEKFFEEFISQESCKCLGVRIVESNEDNRPLGAAGGKELVLTEPIKLLRCFKEIEIKASKKRPLKVLTMLQKLGR